MLLVAMSWSSSDGITYFGFVDDVLFSYNGVNWPELKAMCTFHPVCQFAAQVRSSTMLFGRICQVVQQLQNLPSPTASY